MKKQIATQLNEVASTMPIVYEWVLIPEQFTGAELNLTPLAKHVKYDADKVYDVPMPAMVAVTHKQQIKDAYKRGGLPAVKEYHQSVMAKIKMR